MNCKDMEGNDRSHLQVLHLQFFRRTEETHRKSQDSVLRAEFEPRISHTGRSVSLSCRHFSTLPPRSCLLNVLSRVV